MAEASFLYPGYYMMRPRIGPGLAYILLTGVELLIPPSAEPEEVELLEHAIRAGDVVIEVGARTGAASRVISNMVGRDGFVISLEPNPFSFRRLSSSTRSLPNVLALDFAASSNNGSAGLGLEYVSDGGATLGSRRRWREEQVKTVRLDDLVMYLGLRRVDLLVIDVEGTELEVLKGCTRTLPQVRDLLIEIHEYYSIDLVAKIDTIARENGFELRHSVVISGPPFSILVRLYSKPSVVHVCGMPVT